MPDTMPRLTKPEMARLVEIGAPVQTRFLFDPAHAGISPVVTQKLADKGLVTIEGRRVAKSGRSRDAGRAVLTDLGRAVLVGLREETR